MPKKKYKLPKIIRNYKAAAQRKWRQKKKKREVTESETENKS